jgi:GMP synthase-like glutamine amidotransferase
MTKHICVFQHIDWEGPGQHLQTAALKRNAHLDIIKVWKEPIPSLSIYDALIILGGGPNVDQEDEFPFLQEEKRAIRNWLNSDRPYLGICLGHQLIAEALGARIAPNFCHSIGFTSGHLTGNGKNHPVFRGIDPHPLLFKWHGYAVMPPVPRHFHILATSTECQVEAFSIAGRPHIIGMQFDNHAADPDDVAIWLAQDRKWLSSIQGKQINNSHILKDAKKYHQQIKRDFHTIFANFIEMT